MIYDEYTSKYVLVMEYVDGIDVSQLESLKKNGYDTQKLAKDLACNYISQIIENGFFMRIHIREIFVFEIIKLYGLILV